MHPINNPLDYRTDNIRNAMNANLKTLSFRIPKFLVDDEFLTPVDGLPNLIEHIISISLEGHKLDLKTMDTLVNRYIRTKKVMHNKCT